MAKLSRGGDTQFYYTAGGESGYTGGVSSGTMTNGQRFGNGYTRITLTAISN